MTAWSTSNLNLALANIKASLLHTWTNNSIIVALEVHTHIALWRAWPDHLRLQRQPREAARRARRTMLATTATTLPPCLGTIRIPWHLAKGDGCHPSKSKFDSHSMRLVLQNRLVPAWPLRTGCPWTTALHPWVSQQCVAMVSNSPKQTPNPKVASMTPWCYPQCQITSSRTTVWCPEATTKPTLGTVSEGWWVEGTWWDSMAREAPMPLEWTKCISTTLTTLMVARWHSSSTRRWWTIVWWWWTRTMAALSSWGLQGQTWTWGCNNMVAQVGPCTACRATMASEDRLRIRIQCTCTTSECNNRAWWEWWGTNLTKWTSIMVDQGPTSSPTNSKGMATTACATITLRWAGFKG